MATLKAHWARLRGEEAGFSLPELLVGVMIALITAGTGMVVLQMALGNEPEIRERSAQLQQGRTLVERLTRELRQGDTISSATSSSLQLITYVNSASCGGAASTASTLCRVTYSCSAGTCTRTERNPNGTGSAPAERVASGLVSSNIFSYSPSAADPTWVGVSVSYPGSDGGEAVTMSDGAALRNHFGGV